MDLAGKYRPKERRERSLHLLDMVGLADQAHKLPSMVSGGQQQRAAIVRALANDPPLIVADEPTGNLDQETAHRIFDLFHSSWPTARRWSSSPTTRSWRTRCRARSRLPMARSLATTAKGAAKGAG